MPFLELMLFGQSVIEKANLVFSYFIYLRGHGIIFKTFTFFCTMYSRALKRNNRQGFIRMDKLV